MAAAVAASRRRAVASSWKCDRSELTRISVSAPPQSRPSTAATSSGAASPTSSGTIATSAPSTWRNGSSTSSACSGAWGPSARATQPRSASSPASASWSTSTLPSGVAKAAAVGAAIPRIWT
jgi:hypothetical protein